MKKVLNTSKFQVLAVTAGLIGSGSAVAASPYQEIGSIQFNSGARQMVYSEAYHTLAIRNTASAITLIDLDNSTRSTYLSTWRFTDMDISPDGRYLFAADYGGENIGYGTPLNQSYLHRYDLMAGTWIVNSTQNSAGSVAAVSGNEVILKSQDQWTRLSYEAMGSGSSTTVLNNGFFASIYGGDIEYDAVHHRLLHGNSGLSSQEISAFKVNGSVFFPQESTGMYGSAQGFGGSMVLANDASSLYYGRLQVDALDVTYNRNVFPEIILGATSTTAFGSTHYYDAETGNVLGAYGFTTSVIGVDRFGNDIWAVDAAGHRLVHLAPISEPSEYALMLAGLGLLVFSVRRRNNCIPFTRADV